MGVYLFDTSAARSLGRRDIETAAAQGHQLLLSPITFWELACHLDEEPFRLPRGNIRKGRLFQILDDPLAEMMVDVGCGSVVHSTRFEDREAVAAALEEIEQVSTYAELLVRTVVVRGESRLIGDIARRAQEVFDVEREQFVESIRAQGRRYLEQYGRAGTIDLAGSAFLDEAVELARGLREDAIAGGCNVTFAALADRTVLGCGYAVARTCSYVASVGDGEPLPIDGNDLEDYFISLHLGISSGRTLVTNDGGTRTAIARTFRALRDHFAANGGTLATNTELMTSDEFRTMIVTPAAATQE